MADRRYKNGSRRSAQIRGTGKMSENRFAWLKVAVGQFVILKAYEEENTESGPTIRLLLPFPGRRPISYNMTALTEAELLKLKELFEILFSEALPVVQQRDKVAQDAFDSGDDSFARVYRDVPRLVVRERPKPRHGEGVHDGPEGDASGSGGELDSDSGVRSDSGEVADGEPEEGSSEDDWEEIDLP